MNRSLTLIVLAVMAAGCEEPTVSSHDRFVNRTYLMTACRQSGSEEVVPCTSYVAGSYFYVTDSAHLALRGDGTASWLSAAHSCDIGQPCSATETIVDSLSGTYRFGNDSVIVHFAGVTSSGAHDIFFTGPVPERVSEDWAGPDVLTLALGNGAYSGIFKPE